MRNSTERSGVALTLIVLLVAWGCDGEPMHDDHDVRDDSIEHERAEEEPTAVEPASRPLRLEDPDDILRRAELAIDERIAARPRDAVHREELVRWKAEQILLDDMSEAAPLDDHYGFTADGARTLTTADSHEPQEESTR
jgi:hypothetical protein